VTVISCTICGASLQLFAPTEDERQGMLFACGWTFQPDVCDGCNVPGEWVM
jgi:hypothetical protein